MGQESGRAAWPRPAGGYQTITGRRYGRRHAYISFKPNFKSSGRYRHQNPARVENWEGSVRDGSPAEKHIVPKSPLSTMLHSILPTSNSVHPELKGRTGKDGATKKQPSGRRLADRPVIQFKKLRSDSRVTLDSHRDCSGGSEKVKESISWPQTEERLANSALGFVNIDAYEPDSSGGEEENSGTTLDTMDVPLGQQRRLDDMIYELGKDFDYLRGLQSFLYTKTDCPPEDSAESDCGTGPNPAGEDREPLVDEWSRTQEAERPGDENMTWNRVGTGVDTRLRTALRAGAEAPERLPARESCATQPRNSGKDGTLTGPGPVACQTVTNPTFQHPSSVDGASPLPPLGPETEAASGERGAASGNDGEWREVAEQQRLSSSTEFGVWGSEERGAGAAIASSSTCGNEPVVRPKIRKQSSETQLEQSVRPDPPPNQCCSTARAARAQAPQSKRVSAPPFFLTQTDRPNPELLFSFPPVERMRGEEERMREWLDRKTGVLRRRHREEADGKVDSDSDYKEDDDIWEDLEIFNDRTAPFIKAEDSSDYSEGEWYWPSDLGLEKGQGSSEEEKRSNEESWEMDRTKSSSSSKESWEKDRRSSEESWETLPGPEETSSATCSPGELATQSTGPVDPQAELEEGEVPWLMYNQGASSSEDEGPDPGSHFVHPGLFILDGNNNMDDDSSVSEDLDAEWRLLDDFGEGFGMAQAISYVDPQLLTYMALEERLAQAMEAALAHLESLAIDVEQAHPPATEQMINCLPHITIQEEHSGQEQCCAICCSEYVRDEVATELPCKHMFHKLCVTLWLQKSGTCPVCRHVLTPPLPEATPPTSFLNDQEVPPSNHSTAGTR